MNMKLRGKRQMAGVRTNRAGDPNHVSRFTFPSSEVLLTKEDHAARSAPAFTLIELLVVIAIIAILAALIIPVTGVVAKIKLRTRTRGEMAQIETAINLYHTKHNFYPPDNPGNLNFINQLYYELVGTTNNGTTYTTLDKSSSIAASALTPDFGPNVTGLMNTMQGSAGDQGIIAENFAKGFNANQVGELQNGAKILIGSVGWTGDPNSAPIPPAQARNGLILNPWRYVSSNPTNNPKSFDLWIDIFVAGKTNRICNWTDKALTL